MIKRKLFLLVVIMTLVVSSCSQGVTSEFEVGAPAKLELQLGIGTKTVGAVPTESEDAGIKTVTVGVFDGERVDVIATSAYVVGSKVTVTATAGSRSVVVVANAPEGSFAGIQTKTAFMEKKLELTQDKASMLMSSAFIPTILVAGNTPVSIPVAVTRLAARVQIVSVSTVFDANGAYSKASFEMDKIFMYNVKSQTTVGDASTTAPISPITSTLIHGLESTLGGVVNASLADVLSPKVTFPTAAYTTPSYFYVFENSVAATGDDASATKIVIGGLFKAYPSDAGTYIYYPIVVNKSQLGSDISGTDVVGVKRNQCYEVTAKIKSLGVDSPSKFINPSSIDLTITVTPWKKTKQDVIM